MRGPNDRVSRIAGCSALFREAAPVISEVVVHVTAPNAISAAVSLRLSR